VVDCAILTAIGVMPDGRRSILGTSGSLSEAEVHWRQFLPSLIERGLHGVRFIVSDYHQGLRAAREALFPGVPWQRCQFHLAQNAMAYVPRVAMRSEVDRPVQLANANPCAVASTRFSGGTGDTLLARLLSFLVYRAVVAGGAQLSSVRWDTVRQPVMRRRLITIAIFLLAGAVVNMAVAWASPVLVEPPAAEPSDVIVDSYFRGVSGFDGRRWRTKTADRIVLEHVSVRTGAWVSSEGVVDDWIPEWSRRFFEGPDPHVERRFFTLRRAEARGWPRLALWGAVEQGQRTQQSPFRQPPRFFHAIPIDRPAGATFISHAETRILPTAVIWPGFVVNTIVYAAGMWLLFWCALASRRLIRRRRGLCPACAYPMGEVAVCSECGEPLPKRAVA
jgi:hypothetical protein